MNAFRLIGDFSHFAAIIILLIKLCRTRSCAGISGKSQMLFAMVFVTRYLDLFTTYQFLSLYNTIGKVFFILSACVTLLMFIKFRDTYNYSQDSFRVEFLIIPAVGLALLVNHDYSILEILWTFSIYLESVAVIPQLHIISVTGEVETVIVQYLLALGAYRAMYILNWSYRYYTEDIYDEITIMGGCVQIVFYVVFFYFYITKMSAAVLNGSALSMISDQTKCDKLTEVIEELEEPTNQKIENEDIVSQLKQEIETQAKTIEDMSQKLALRTQQKDQVLEVIRGSKYFAESKWKECQPRPRNMTVYDQPVALNDSLYARGWLEGETVLKYTPTSDEWSQLPPPPVENFTLATLQGQLLVIGGKSKITDKRTDIILSFNESSNEWLETLPCMPTALSRAAVLGYKDYLIIATGSNLHRVYIHDVNILSTSTNEWITAQPVPIPGYYQVSVIEDYVYLAGIKKGNAVLRAHLPTLVSGSMSGVWEMLPRHPYTAAAPVVIENKLALVGGCVDGKPTTDICWYDQAEHHWVQVMDLPESMFSCRCLVEAGKLFILDSITSHLVYSLAF